MRKVFWDTNLFIYLIEDSGERGDALFTSALTLSEVLVKPIERPNVELRARYEESIIASASVLPFETSAARHFARIRMDRSLRPADAVQLACAASTGIDLFIASDDRLNRKVVPGIQFIQPLGRAFL